MIIRCPKCGTDFALEADSIGPEGVTLRCSVCSHVFHAELVAPGAGVDSEPWQIASPEKHLFTVPDVRTILAYIADGRITPDHQVSRSGKAWVSIGDLPEFSSAFVAHGSYGDLPKVVRVIESRPPMIGDPMRVSGILGPPEDDNAGLLGPPPEYGSDEGPRRPRPHEEVAALLSSAVSMATKGPIPAPPDHGIDAPIPAPRPASMLEAVTNAVSHPSMSAQSLAGTPSSSLLASGPKTPPKPVEEEKPAASERSAAREPGGEDSKPSEQSEVVIVKVEKEEESSNAIIWFVLLGLAIGLVVLLSPDLRARIPGLGGPQVVTPPPAPVPPAAAVSPEQLNAQRAIQNLGLAETDAVQKDLQNIIDNRIGDAARIDRAKLSQAEMLAMRALAFSIAAAIDSGAVDGAAGTRATEDAKWAEAMFKEVGRQHITDLAQHARVEGLLALVNGKPSDEVVNLLPPTGAEIVRLAVDASVLWRDPQASVPPGLIGRLQAALVPGTSTLTQCLLAITLARSGDDEGAQRLIQQILVVVPDQPLAMTLNAWLAGRVAQSGTPPTTPGEFTTAPTDPAVAPDAKGDAPRRPVISVEAKIDRACEQIHGEEVNAGVKVLIDLTGSEGEFATKAHLCTAEGYRKLDRLDSALTYFDRVLKTNSRHRKALKAAAEIAVSKKMTEQAISYYRRLLEVDPNDSAAIVYLSEHGVERPKPAPAPAEGESASGGE
ncbi:MAG: zinc-ribbon domain-containing protein [Myxococcales bacterium]|nr:zinc-ribbon domain-containing protein [Myxococcales bacterium]MCB9751629.1 zinc-ribbon domain-containing protein [Myxococcales bacterium]